MAIVVTVGRNALLDLTFASGWCVGLVDSAGFTAYSTADTMSSHAGWSESQVYTEAIRPTYSPAAAAAGSATNTTAKAVFTINATVTIRGAFLTSSPVKGGTAGTLYGIGDFAVPRSVMIGNVLHVTIIVTD